MLRTIKTTHFPAEDLGYLLQKNPKKHHEFLLSCGKAHLFKRKKLFLQKISCLMRIRFGR